MSNGQNLGDANIRRGIFRGDSLSPLLFVVCLIPLSVILRKTKGKYQLGKEGESINHLLFMDDVKLYGNDERQIDSLINTVRVSSDDIRMAFGLKKCEVVVMKRGKVVKYDGVDLPDERRMKSVEENGYKYLGILEYDEFLHAETKIRLQNEYYRRLKRSLKSKLNGKNVIIAVNTWAVSVLRYGAGVINWTKAELESIDRKTRKQMTIYGMLHPLRGRTTLVPPKGSTGAVDLRVSRIVFDSKRQDWQTMSNPLRVLLWLLS